MEILIKQADESDFEIAFQLTKELMAYHNALDIFVLTPKRLKELIVNGEIYSYIVYADKEAIGLMNCFWKLTTFTGRKILYIEDLYTKEQYRGSGIGKKLIEKAKSIALENDCEQIELKCINWNKNSAGFYESIGMKSETEWITYTMDKSLF